MPGEQGFALEVAEGADCLWWWPEECDELLAALAKGIEVELRKGLGAQCVLAARVVITSVRTHEVDSHPLGFERHGRLLAQEMLKVAREF
ncbi:hypothetical protein [Streptomyces sp. NPDC048650]|uniref:hypothetical protein n=1 Tax=unclassified Streptomyces TaxID=2593676 RepID=UPI0037199D6D